MEILPQKFKNHRRLNYPFLSWRRVIPQNGNGINDERSRWQTAISATISFADT